MSFFEFQRRFPDEKACRDHLLKVRWPEGFVCPRCGSRRACDIPSRRQIECLDCRHQTSATAGTIFHKTRMPLRTWFWMIYLLSTQKKSLSILQMQKDLEIGSYKTAWMMSQKIRLAMARDARVEQLAGLVELDDAYYGGAAEGGKRGRGAEGKRAVVAAVSKAKTKRGRECPQKLAFQVCSGGVDCKSIGELAGRQIAEGSRVVTDGLSANREVARTGKGLEHVGVTIHGDRKLLREALKWIHVCFANSKRFLLGTHHSIGARSLAVFLGEFAWRFNHRGERNPFAPLLSQCLKTPPRRLRDLLAPEGLEAFLV